MKGRLRPQISPFGCRHIEVRKGLVFLGTQPPQVRIVDCGRANLTWPLHEQADRNTLLDVEDILVLGTVRAYLLS